MEKLHQSLSSRSPLYKWWHNEPYKAVHWVVFILVAVLVTLAIIVGINGQFPRSIPSDASQAVDQTYLLKPQRIVAIGYNNISLTVLEQTSEDNVRTAKIRVTPGDGGAAKEFDNLKTGDSFEAFGVKFTVTVLYRFRQLAAIRVTLPDQVATNPATLSITNAPTAPIKVGEIWQFSASYDPDGSGTQPAQTVQVQWSSSAASVATIDQAGLAKGITVGGATISAIYENVNAKIDITIAPVTDNATSNGQFVSQIAAPLSMIPGQSAQVSIIMKNTGTTTWTKSTGFKLESQNPQGDRTWGLSWIELEAADSIAPNQTKTFTFTVTSPASPGTYNFQWQMSREAQGGVQRFGDKTTNVVVTVATSGGAATLRSLAQAKGRFIGAPIGSVNDARNSAIIREFSSASFYYGSSSELWTGPHEYNFSVMDGLVNYARQNGMQANVLTAIWPVEPVPAWLKFTAACKNSGCHPGGGSGGGADCKPKFGEQCNQSPTSPSEIYTTEELRGLLHDYVQAVVSHYRGKATFHMLVNELVDHDSPWAAIGSDYISMVYRWAREADPNVKLYYNDFGAESNLHKADEIYDLIAGLGSTAPINAVGFQMHLSGEIQTSEVVALLERFAALGVETNITEMDGDYSANGTSYGNALTACLSVPSCKSFTIWNFDDFFDQNLQPKPAYNTLRDILSR